VALVAILEDDERRRAAFLTYLEGHEVQLFNRAPRMLAWLKEHLSECTLISLDNDLFLVDEGSEGASEDPGEGREVADWLGEQTPACPVLVHSSNHMAAYSIRNSLHFGGWEQARVTPFSDLDWVELSWAPKVRAILAGEFVPDPFE
tara:strand:+ start:159 stop:599 length:441 start_codon:yes stop_codon:yes gene_type:complete